MEKNDKWKIKSKILYLSFNQDHDCLAVGMGAGYRIYDLKNTNLNFYERAIDGGVNIIEMLYRTNILALVGVGRSKEYPKNKVLIFDDNIGKTITELSFKIAVQSVKFKKELMVVVCGNTIDVISLPSFKKIETIETELKCVNKTILFALNVQNPEKHILAHNGKVTGEVIVNNYAENPKTFEKVKAFTTENACISCLEFNKIGNILAVTGEYNKYIKLYKTDEGVKLIYRFIISDRSLNIVFLSFEENTDFLCASLEDGLIEVFDLRNLNQKNDISFSKKDNYIGFGNIVNDNNQGKVITDTRWSYFYIHEHKAVCTFSVIPYHIICIGSKANYYLTKFDDSKKGCLGHREEEKSLLYIHS